MSLLTKASVGSVAFVGNYPPRQCGIATFTQDIRDSVAAGFPNTECTVCAINDGSQPYNYAPPVRYEIEQNELGSYLRAADFINITNTDVVCIQHEYGIYGGVDGSYILDLAAKLRAPIVSTFHTVIEQPTSEQRRILSELASISKRVIVMSDYGKDTLTRNYAVSPDKIDLIPHGIPDMPFADTCFYKDKIGAAGKFLMLTFGLLSANKGIEFAIGAMPAILEEFPDFVYVVLGATHPNVLRTEGERYRELLMQKAADAGVEHAVQFHNKYVDIDELKEYLAAADIYVTPYLNSSQVTSGTLAYAFGCGKAVVSTPYVHATELLGDDRGVIVPFASAKAIADAVLGLLRETERRDSMRKRAYMFGREMIWSEVARRYVDAFSMARLSYANSVTELHAPARQPGAVPPMPPINLSHLHRLTDSTGIIQHACYTLPNYSEGYCADDNARALDLAVMLDAVRTPELARGIDGLTSTYAAFINAAFDPETHLFHNFMSYDRSWLDDRGSDDCQGRCVRALGTCVEKSGDPYLRQWAAGLLQLAAPKITEMTSVRAWAHALIGIDSYLSTVPGDTAIKRVAVQLDQLTLGAYEAHRTDEWPWFEPILSYDCALAPHALILRGRGSHEMLETGLTSLRWLTDQQTAPNGHFRPIGSQGFYSCGSERAVFDQQPIEAACTVSACLAAFEATREEFWSRHARLAFDWFNGRNDVQIALYDARTGGCCDGLREDRPNKNQGAESTLAYLMARILISGSDVRTARNGFSTRNEGRVARSAATGVVTEKRINSTPR